MVTRREVLGDAHVDRAEAAKTEFDEPFQNLITDAAWGHVWSRGNITKRERSMITIALLAALGHDEEVAMHGFTGVPMCSVDDCPRSRVRAGDVDSGIGLCVRQQRSRLPFDFGSLFGRLLCGPAGNALGMPFLTREPSPRRT